MSPKDFAKSTKSQDTSISPLPGWMWLSSGLLIGFFISFLLYLAQVVPHKSDLIQNKNHLATDSPIPPIESSTHNPSSESNQAPQFTFYKDLTQFKLMAQQVAKLKSNNQPSQSAPQNNLNKAVPVKSSEPELAAISNSKQTASSPPIHATPSTRGTTKTYTTSDTNAYLLQTDSFRQQADAERRRAELLLLGFDVNIQRVSLKSKGTWYRVTIGPFNTKNEIRKARRLLARNKIATNARVLPIRLQQPNKHFN